MVSLEKERKEYEKRLQDPTFLYLKSILTQDRKGEEQAQRTERYINVDKTNITTRKKKRNETADLW